MTKRQAVTNITFSSSLFALLEPLLRDPDEEEDDGEEGFMGVEEECLLIARIIHLMRGGEDDKDTDELFRMLVGVRRFESLKMINQSLM